MHLVGEIGLEVRMTSMTSSTKSVVLQRLDLPRGRLYFGRRRPQAIAAVFLFGTEVRGTW